MYIFIMFIHTRKAECEADMYVCEYRARRDCDVFIRFVHTSRSTMNFWNARSQMKNDVRQVSGIARVCERSPTFKILFYVIDFNVIKRLSAARA